MRGPDRNQSITTQQGVTIPNGAVIDFKLQPSLLLVPSLAVAHFLLADEEHYQLQHNEFIVYNEGQVQMRYLVQVGPPRKKYLAALAKKQRDARRGGSGRQ